MNHERFSQAIGRLGVALIGFYVMSNVYWLDDYIEFPLVFLPSIYFFIEGGWGLPLLLLTAILERPYVSRAGVQRNALAVSFQATTFSGFVVGGLIGLLALVGPPRGLWFWIPDIVFLFGMFVGSWGIVTCLKFWYITRRCRDLLPTTWKLIWSGSLVSYFAVPIIYVIAKNIGAIIGNDIWSRDPSRFKWWSQFGPKAYSTLIVVSAVFFGGSFVWPWLHGRFGPHKTMSSETA